MAMEKPHLLGRYCLAHESISLTDVLQIVHENFNDIDTIPTRKVRDFVVRTVMSSDTKTGRAEYLNQNLSRIPRIQCSKAEQAGMLLRPISQTILDTVRYFQDHGYLEDDSSRNSIIGGSCIIT